MKRTIRPLLWCLCLAVCGCSGLSKPVVDPQTGKPIMRPDGTPQTVYDSGLETGAGQVSLLTGNALLAPAILGLGALARTSVLNRKES